MKHFILVLILIAMFPGNTTPQDNAATIKQKLSIYNEQQIQMINMIITHENNKEEAIKESKNVVSQRDVRRYIDRLEVTLRDNDAKINDIKVKLIDLKIKVLETAGEIPAWWKENEDFLDRMQNRQ